MTTLPDINNIITNFSKSPFNNDKDNQLLFNFFENYILSDNCLYHMDLVNNHFYQQLKKNDSIYFDNFKQLLYSKIKFFLTQHIKEIRNNIRMRYRINQIDIRYIINFIKIYNTKIKKLDSLLNHFKTDREKCYMPNKFWGGSAIIELGINILYNILLTDNSLTLILNNTITCQNNNIDVIKNMRIFTSFMKIFSQYGHSYKIYVDTLDDILVQNIPKLHPDNTCNIYNIYNFKVMFNYTNEINKTYYTLLTDKKFNLNEKFDRIIKILIDQLSKIVHKQSITQLIIFFETYEQELQKLIKIYPDTYKVLTTFMRLNSFHNFILYSQQVFKLCNSRECLHLIQIYTSQVFKEISDEDIKLCTSIINKNIINKKIENNTFMYNIFSQPFYEKYIDVFLQYLEQNFIERLVYYDYNLTNIHIYEDQNMELMKYHFKESYLKKFTFILKDFIISKEFQLKNCESEYYKYTKDVFSLIVTRDVWNININSGFLKLNNIQNTLPFSKQLRCEDIRYRNNNDYNKYLIFYPHIGSVNITLEGNKQNTHITMLPIQMLFLELFYETTILSKEFVKTTLIPNFKNYNTKILTDVINSFIESNIIIDLKHINVFELNLDYTQEEHLNLIEVYNNISHFEVVKEKQMKIELVHSREKILSTVFNHILKTKSLTVNDLVLHATKLIKQFPLKQELITTTIKHMKEKDYITIDQDTHICKKIDF